MWFTRKIGKFFLVVMNELFGLGKINKKILANVEQ